MNTTPAMLFSSSARASIPAALLCALALLLPGCGKDKGGAAARLEPSPRPVALVQATEEIKYGQSAQAEQTIRTFMQAEPESVYLPESYYLLGQSLAEQGRFDEALKAHEEAMDTTKDKNLKGLAKLGQADCSYGQGKYARAAQQYHNLENMHRGVQALPQDEILYKLGMAYKKDGSQVIADYWFKQVAELYAHSPYAEKAMLESSKYTPPDHRDKPLVYTLEVQTFSREERAEEEAGILRAKGYADVQVIKATRNNDPVYEVHVGRFANKNSAALAQTDAELAGLPTTIRPATFNPLP